MHMSMHTKPSPSDDTMTPAEALRVLCQIVRSLHAVVALLRLDIEHGDHLQGMAALIQIHLRPLEDAAVALLNADCTWTAEQGGEV